MTISHVPDSYNCVSVNMSECIKEGTGFVQFLNILGLSKVLTFSKKNLVTQTNPPSKTNNHKPFFLTLPNFLHPLCCPSHQLWALFQAFCWPQPPQHQTQLFHDMSLIEGPATKSHKDITHTS